MVKTEAVRIEEPCGVDFRKLTRAEATKRFCGECRKHVHDLTLMTETEALALLERGKTEDLCVAYLADDHGKLVFLPDVPTARLTRRRREGLAALAAASLGLSACSTPIMAGGLMREPSVPAAVAMSYEIGRGETRVSIVDSPGAFIDLTNATGGAPAGFLTGQCTGDEAGCKEARELLDQSKSTDEYVSRLQTAGFTILQQVKGPNPCAGRVETTST